jgi:small subunit ribosomal protein S21
LRIFAFFLVSASGSTSTPALLSVLYKFRWRNASLNGQTKTLLISTAALPATFKEQPLQIIVRDNNIDQALKALKKKMQREGIFREMKLRGHYEKPSEKRARERAEAIRRYRKLQRKRLQREGVLPK